MESAQGSISRTQSSEVHELCPRKDIFHEDSLDGKEADDSKSISSAGDYGEPLKTQFLRLDFTQVEGVDDNEYNFNKCVAFWKLIDEHPELNSLKVEPEVNDPVNVCILNFNCLLQKRKLFREQGPYYEVLEPSLFQCEREMDLYGASTRSISSAKCKVGSVEGTGVSDLLKEKENEDPFLASGMKPKRQSTYCKRNRLDSLSQMMADMHKFDLERPK